MKKNFCITLVALAWLVGCAKTPAPTTSTDVTTTSENQQVATVDSANSRVVSVEQGGVQRTEANSRSSHSDAEGSRASVSVSAVQKNPDGKVSQRDSVMKVSSEGDGKDSLGYTQDDKHIAITGSNVVKTWTAAGQDVAISGSNNTLTFLGNTHGLSVTGSDNRVEVENSEIVEVSGEHNQVVYTGTAPTIEKSGNGNSVVAK